MFGYIKPFKPEMKVKEFDTYKAIYCGLCKQLGSVYGPFARMTLSYDFTFLSLISLSLKEVSGLFRHEKCIVNPLKKKACLTTCEDLTFGASTAMIMFYYKLKDNYDDGGIKDKSLSLSLMPFARQAKRKAAKRYPYLDEIVSECINQQNIVEHSDSLSIDYAAEPSAGALGRIFECLSDDKTEQTVLNRLGYFVGRFVYFIDALDDLEDDIKTGGYNIFYKKFVAQQNTNLEQIKECAKGVINLTIGQIASAYELLNIKHYKTILDNIIYLGFHNSLYQVLHKEQKRLNRERELYYGKSI